MEPGRGSDLVAAMGDVPEPQAEPDVKSLLQEANAMLKKLGNLSAMRVPTWELQGQIDVAMRSLGLENSGVALLDSGATHVFRSETEEDLSQSEMIHVQAADGQLVALQQNRAGTLMPVRTDPSRDAPTTIILLRALVGTLGGSLEWSRGRGLVVEHPEHEFFKLGRQLSHGGGDPGSFLDSGAGGQEA